ncbi:hypothetical protein KKH27_12120 [bacterium]|nr:hypothetical protein [bacterium]MBU1983571.1 hypothetical protein [bacterium]
MNREQRLFFAWAFTLLMAVSLWASRPEMMGGRPGEGRLDYTDLEGGYSGRPLTPEEWAIIDRAIDSIGGDGDDTLIYTNSEFEPCTLLRGAIAWDLFMQLCRGKMEVETLATKRPKNKPNASCKPDCLATPDGDEINISDSLLRAVLADPSQLDHLEGVLVHEYVHKIQTAEVLRDKARREMEAYWLMHAYYCSVKVPAGDKERDRVKNARDAYTQYVTNGTPPEEQEDYYVGVNRDGDHYCYLVKDPAGVGSDTLISYELGDTVAYEFLLGETDAGDLLVFPEPPMYPPGHSRGLVFGQNELSGAGRILALHLLEGEVIEPPTAVDFGLPLYPPMFFSAAGYSEARGRFFVVDTIGRQILHMVDINGDLLPDEIEGVYASAAWPGFELLDCMRGVDVSAHPFIGFGLTVSCDGRHAPEDVFAYEERWFLPDTDGDNVADLCEMLPVYQFLRFTPAIQYPPLWAGEMMVMLHGSWEHDIAVFASDSMGEVLFDQVGFVHMGPGIDMECPLLRPLLPGEFVIPVDMYDNRRPRLATPVVDPTPRSLTLFFDFDGQLHLRWEAVAGADHYLIYTSTDAISFGWTGDIAQTNEFVFPVPPEDVLFYRVTAEK